MYCPNCKIMLFNCFWSNGLELKTQSKKIFQEKILAEALKMLILPPYLDVKNMMI